MYIVGENTALSNPDSRQVRKALEGLDFLVVQDLFLTETARYAHVVLPGASFAEKEGTFTNTERRIQRLRKAIEPIGRSRPDWLITCQMAQALGAQGFDFGSPAEIMEEIARVTPIYGGVSYPRLEGNGLQWPCTSAEHPGTATLFAEGFGGRKARFVPTADATEAAIPDREYHYLLVTERMRYHFNSGAMTGRVKGTAALEPQGCVELDPGDAAQLGIREGEPVRVISRQGEVVARARVPQTPPPGSAPRPSGPGLAFLPIHFAQVLVNELTQASMDQPARTPALKACAVRLEKLQ